MYMISYHLLPKTYKKTLSSNRYINDEATADRNRKCTLQWRHNSRDDVSNHQPHGYLLNRLFRRRSKKASKLRVTGLCVGNSPVTGEFPAQKAINAEIFSIWWRHHEQQNPNWVWIKKSIIFFSCGQVKIFWQHTRLHVYLKVLLRIQCLFCVQATWVKWKQDISLQPAVIINNIIW